MKKYKRHEENTSKEVQFELKRIEWLHKGFLHKLMKMEKAAQITRLI